MAAQSGTDKPVVPAGRAFADLRKRNEYHSRVARMLEAARARKAGRIADAQRKRRTHQAR